MTKDQLNLILDYIRLYSGVSLIFIITGTSKPDLMLSFIVMIIAASTLVSLISILRSKA